jgi:DNA-binding GntR family transcriptional regulator
MLVRERLYLEIKRDILSGVFRMGDRLPVEELAAQHQVSKTPVREALSSLEHEGLVQTVPRVGYFVAQLTVQGVQELFQLRLVLEGASAQLAAASVTQLELDRLDLIPCDWVLGDMDSYLGYLSDNRKFHCGVAEASGNRQLVDLVGKVLDRMQGMLLWELELRNRPSELADEHRQLILALRRRDGGQARAIMEAAILEMQTTLMDTVFGRLALSIGGDREHPALAGTSGFIA